MIVVVVVISFIGVSKYVIVNYGGGVVLVYVLSINFVLVFWLKIYVLGVMVLGCVIVLSEKFVLFDEVFGDLGDIL